MNEIEQKCKSFNCENFIEWSFGYGPCISCKLQGESYSIEEIAEECPYKNKFKN